MVIEYKGAHLEKHDAEKKNMGELWEESAREKGLFVWMRKTDEQSRPPAAQLAAAIERHARRWNG